MPIYRKRGTTPFFNSANKLLLKFEKNYKARNKKFMNSFKIMPLKTIEKTLTEFYEKVQNSDGNVRYKESFYEMFINRYGMPKLAEK